MSSNSPQAAKPKKPTSKGTRSSPRKPKSKNTVLIEDAFNGLSLQSQKPRSDCTAMLYNTDMLDYYSLRKSDYPENPTRISAPFKRCQDLGIVDRCKMLTIKPCNEKAFETMHSADYVKKIAGVATKSQDELIAMEHSYDGVCFHNNVMKCAKVSAGATFQLVEAVARDEVANGFAIIRPPGHHAMNSKACGYCYFNNVALAAQRSLEVLNMKKVLIVDWDVHHGQGTQYMFYDDPRVLYISIHRYEHGWFWPNLKESNFDAIGKGEGVGYNINIPLNTTGMTDGDYLCIFNQVIMPVAMEFDPDLVIVSAGYDCAVGCPEGEMEVSPPAFGHLVHYLKSLANGRLAMVLEGGYCIQSLIESVAYSIYSLLNDPCPRLKPTAKPKPELVNTLLNTINALRPYWTCLKYQNLDISEKSVKLDSCDPRGEPEFYIEELDYFDFDDFYPIQTPETMKEFDRRITQLVKEHPIRQTKHRTSYVYDDFMMKHKCVVDPTHPERPDRISRIHAMLGEYGLLEKCLKLPSRLATHDELKLVHSLKYIEEIEAFEITNPREFKDLELRYNSIYLHKESYKCALMAAGSLFNVVDSVMTDESRNGYAIIRPPGHHAEQSLAYGFCFFNSVPLAAKYAQSKYNVGKIAIIDWDVHHGNGTQHMFEDDNSILYISLHRYDDAGFFPCSEDGNYDKVGIGEGEGYNVNIPFSRRYYEYHSSRAPGDPEYIAAFQQIIMPICYEFSPELVLISAGFDAAKGDPLGGYRITPAGYAHMTHMLSSLANGRLIMALEGGYNLNSISESYASCVDVMLGGNPPRIPYVAPDQAAVENIKDVITTHKKYWKSLCCDEVLPYTQEELDEIENKKQQQTEQQTQGVSNEDRMGGLMQLLSEMMERSGISSRAAANVSEEKSGEIASQPEIIMGATGGIEESVSGVDAEETPQLYAVVPLTWCPHLEVNKPLPHDLDTSQPCEECGAVGENWVCLTCYKVLCSRFVNEHMLFHAISTEHRMVLSYADLSVWCYACDSYVHNEVLAPMKDSAHRSKFGTNDPSVSS